MESQNDEGSPLDLEHELEEALAAQRELRELLEHRGWRRLLAYLQGRLDSDVQNLILLRVTSLDMVFRTEYDKGVLAERLAFASTPETLIAGLELDIENLRQAIETRDSQKEKTNG